MKVLECSFTFFFYLFCLFLVLAFYSILVVRGQALHASGSSLLMSLGGSPGHGGLHSALYLCHPEHLHHSHHTLWNFLLQRISFHPGIDQNCKSKFAKNPRLNFRFIWKRGLWRRAQRVLVVTVLDAISGRQTCPTVIPFLWPRAWYEFTKCTPHAKCPFLKIGPQFVSSIIQIIKKMVSCICG